MIIEVLQNYLWKPVLLQVGVFHYRGTIVEISSQGVVKLQHKFYPEFSNNKICTYHILGSSIVCISELVMPQDQDIILKSINN